MFLAIAFIRVIVSWCSLVGDHRQNECRGETSLDSHGELLSLVALARGCLLFFFFFFFFFSFSQCSVYGLIPAISIKFTVLLKSVTCPYSILSMSSCLPHVSFLSFSNRLHSSNMCFVVSCPFPHKQSPVSPILKVLCM